MLSLTVSVLGVLASTIPKALSMWQDKFDKAHELNIMKTQPEIHLDQTAIDAGIREV